MPDEHQALIAALKADRSFVTVEEWTAKVDRRKGVTVLGKESSSSGSRTIFIR